MIREISDPEPGPAGIITSVRKALLEHLPDFCWQTKLQVVTYLEQIDEDVSIVSIDVQLWRLAKEGLIDMRTGCVNPERFGAYKRRPRLLVRMYKARNRPPQRSRVCGVGTTYLGASSDI